MIPDATTLLPGRVEGATDLRDMLEMKQNCVRLCWMLLASAVISCDLFHEDEIGVDKVVTINPAQTEYFIPEEYHGTSTSVVISLKALVTMTFETISIRVTEYPKYGKFVLLGDFFLKYTPSETFYEDAYAYDERKDQFEISFFGDEKRIATQSISVRMEKFPCSLYAVEDRIATGPGTPVSSTVTLNDRLCDINIDNVKSSIALGPQHGHAEIEGFTVTYTPEAGYVGPDEFIYELKATKQENIDSQGPLISYGLVTANVGE